LLSVIRSENSNPLIRQIKPKRGLTAEKNVSEAQVFFLIALWNKKFRPFSESMTYISRLVKEGWTENPAARPTALRFKKNLSKLIPAPPSPVLPPRSGSPVRIV